MNINVLWKENVYLKFKLQSLIINILSVIAGVSLSKRVFHEHSLYTLYTQPGWSTGQYHTLCPVSMSFFFLPPPCLVLLFSPPFITVLFFSKAFHQCHLNEWFPSSSSPNRHDLPLSRTSRVIGASFVWYLSHSTGITINSSIILSYSPLPPPQHLRQDLEYSRYAVIMFKGIFGYCGALFP